MKRNNFKDISKYFKKYGYKLISTEDEYLNVESKLNYICPSGHKNSMSYHNFKNGNRCPDCSLIKNKKYNIDYIREYFSSNKYELLSNNYKNKDCKLLVRCPNGHIYKTSFGNFRSGYRCRKCYDLNRGRKRTENRERTWQLWF